MPFWRIKVSFTVDTANEMKALATEQNKTKPSQNNLNAALRTASDGFESSTAVSSVRHLIVISDV